MYALDHGGLQSLWVEIENMSGKTRLSTKQCYHKITLVSMAFRIIFYLYIHGKVICQNTFVIETENKTDYFGRMQRATPLCSYRSMLFWKKNRTHLKHYDVIKWKYCPRYWPFVCGIHWSLTQRPVTQSFDVLFDLRLRFGTPSCSLWRNCKEKLMITTVFITFFLPITGWKCAISTAKRWLVVTFRSSSNRLISQYCGRDRLNKSSPFELTVCIAYFANVSGHLSWATVYTWQILFIGFVHVLQSYKQIPTQIFVIQK